MTNVAGFIAFLVTVTYTCIGLPAQIRENARNEQVGLSLLTLVLMFLTFSSWVAYGMIKSERDWYVVGSNFPGAIFAMVMLFQFWRYRNNDPHSKIQQEAREAYRKGEDAVLALVERLVAKG